MPTSKPNELYPGEPRRWSMDSESGDELSELRLTASDKKPGVAYLVIFEKDIPLGEPRKAYHLTPAQLRELAFHFTIEADLLERELANAAT